jgi:phosphoenolpyruvate synthase/pyruvate phosphate dikinase
VNRLKKDRETLPEVGKAIRQMFIAGDIPEEIEEEIRECYRDGDEITVSCAEGDRGHVYKGILKYEEAEVSIEELPKN